MTRYRTAVADAEVAEPGEINDMLVTADTRPDMMLRKVTWTSWEGYDAYIGRELALQREVWVTSEREMSIICYSWRLRGPELSLRLEQLLGLPPGTGKDRVVTMAVAARDLFRPCPDPEINDSTCELDFPAGVSDTHRAWFEDLRARSYGEGGYPWTRLGYTYDWGSLDSEVGLSEFVVRAGAVVQVLEIVSQDDYCAPP